MAALLKPADPVARLRDHVARHESQRAAAAALKIPASYLSDLLNGRRDFSAGILERMGLERVVVERTGRRS